MKNKQTKFRVLITGGDSGGHIYPLMAVVAELQTLASNQAVDLEVRYAGTYGAFKQYIEENDVRVQKIAGSKMRRYFSPMNFVDIPKFAWSIMQALWKIYWFMPNVVFSKGGVGSLPVVLVARFYRIPVVVHESDAIPGLNNRISAKFADTIAVSFSKAGEYLQGKNIVLTGGPVRKYLLSEDVSKERAKGFFGFKTDEPLILVLGGSQGAQQINDLILDTLKELLNFSQVFHQTGKTNYEAVLSEAQVALKGLSEPIKDRYKAMDYFEKDLRLALRAADLVISRAGAGFIFEIAAFGAPSLLIPLSGSANNHQEANAIEYQKAGATIVMEPNNLLPHLFVENVKNLLNNPTELEKMKQGAISFYKPTAASNLAEIVLKYK
ncbi:MAG: UDP-N-acetylglucosamine--N-acetylmuramyl-(pentapeptide) pyrophosphoryl-undecaprenol N-acetylglucosamine transferase [Patescibacteria group bacterium]